MRIDPAGWPFILGAAAGTLGLVPFAPFVALLGLALLAFCLNFFRDPERTAPSDPGAIVCPADGRIIRADAQRVSIFMNVFNVHVCRTPIGGRVLSVDSRPGRFIAAMKDEASDHNERTMIDVAGGGVRVRFTLVAGLIARRIVCRTAPGAELRAGDRVGIIRFGSRVDVDLPEGAALAVALGDRVVAGESVIARLAPLRS